MSKSRKAQRAPTALKADDPKLIVEQVEPLHPPGAQSLPDKPPARIPESAALKRGIRWGAFLASALGGLLALASGLWLGDLVTAMVGRNDWLGWLTLGLLALAGLSAFMMALAEIWALFKLRRLGNLRQSAQSAIDHDDLEGARKAALGVKTLYASRDDLAWGRSQLAEHEGDVMDARDRLVLSERTLVKPLDEQVSSLIAATARRVSVVTAVSPSTITDMVAVAFFNLRLLRRIAAIYGARPGMLGLMRLARMVVTHIALTGGIAIGDDLLQQLIGQRLTAKLSARLGEGVFNGALTARIGLATIDVCRPLPFIEATRPRFRDLLALVLK